MAKCRGALLCPREVEGEHICRFRGGGKHILRVFMARFSDDRAPLAEQKGHLENHDRTTRPKTVPSFRVEADPWMRTGATSFV